MQFQCPHCQGIVAIDDSEMGEPVGCGHCGEITTVPKTRFSAGVMINDFIIRDTLGHGGMGTVFLAHQYSLDRPVALKILMEQFSANSEFIVDFVKEARAAARLNHPNIVQSYAVGEEDGIYFFAMEYVEGKTLKQMLENEGAIPVPRALNIVLQVAEALDFAWKNQQLVHRDIKPDNIMLTHRGVAKLADLGLARMAHETLEDDEDLVMGTPQYICPEQLLGQPMDVRGDIYSLGATLFHAVTGEFPFDGRSASEIARKHLQEAMPDPRSIKADVPATVVFVLKKMMAKKIEQRYDDAQELAMDLSLILRNENPVGFGKDDDSANAKSAAAKPSREAAGASASSSSSSGGGGVKFSLGKKGGKKRMSTSAGKSVSASAPSSELVTSSQTSTRLPATPADAEEEELDDLEEAPTTTDALAGADAAAEPVEAEDDDEDDADADDEGAKKASGGRSKRIKIGKKRTKFSTGSTTGRSTSTGLRTGTGSGTAVMAGVTDPGTAEGSGGGGGGGSGKVLLFAGIGVAVLVVIIALIAAGLFVAKAKHYSPKSESEVVELYFSVPHVTEAEHTAYLGLIEYFGQADANENNLEALRKVTTDAANFMANYPDSLFTKPANEIDYQTMFETPMSLFAAKIEPEGSKVAGSVQTLLDQYNAKLLLKLREERSEEYREEIARRQEEVKRLAQEGAALKEIEVAIDQRRAGLEKKLREFKADAPKRAAMFEKEQQQAREHVVKLGIDKKYRDAFFEVQTLKQDTTEYDEPLENTVPIYLKQEESSGSAAVRSILESSRGLNLVELQTQSRAMLRDKQISTLRAEIQGLSDSNKNFSSDRDKWFDNFQKMVGNAQAFWEIVANSKDALKETKIDWSSISVKPGEKADILRVTPTDVEVRVYKLDPGTGKRIPQRTESKSLEDIPAADFLSFAKQVWGTRDTSEFQIKQASWIIVSGEAGALKEATSALEFTGDDLRDFVQDEQAKMEPIIYATVIDGWITKMKEWAAKGDKVRPKKAYEVLRQFYGELDQFKDREREMLDILTQ